MNLFSIIARMHHIDKELKAMNMPDDVIEQTVRAYAMGAAYVLKVYDLLVEKNEKGEVTEEEIQAQHEHFHLEILELLKEAENKTVN